MWIRMNPNPYGLDEPDCVVRAISIAMNRSWYDVYWDICTMGAEMGSMPNVDKVWGKYLYDIGFEPFILPRSCPNCVTVDLFCRMFPRGIYIIGTGYHAVAVIDGNYYDSWDSGNEIASFFWRIR